MVPHQPPSLQHHEKDLWEISILEAVHVALRPLPVAPHPLALPISESRQGPLAILITVFPPQTDDTVLLTVQRLPFEDNLPVWTPGLQPALFRFNGFWPLNWQMLWPPPSRRTHRTAHPLSGTSAPGVRPTPLEGAVLSSAVAQTQTLLSALNRLARPHSCPRSKYIGRLASPVCSYRHGGSRPRLPTGPGCAGRVTETFHALQTLHGTMAFSHAYGR